MIPCTHGKGWTQPYPLEMGGATAGYGPMRIGGPWTGSRTLFEFYVAPQHRSRLFELFDCLLTADNATAMKAQTNDTVLPVMLHAWAQNISSELPCSGVEEGLLRT